MELDSQIYRILSVNIWMERCKVLEILMALCYPISMVWCDILRALFKGDTRGPIVCEAAGNCIEIHSRSQSNCGIHILVFIFNNLYLNNFFHRAHASIPSSRDWEIAVISLFLQNKPPELCTHWLWLGILYCQSLVGKNYVWSYKLFLVCSFCGVITVTSYLTFLCLLYVLFAQLCFRVLNFFRDVWILKVWVTLSPYQTSYQSYCYGLQNYNFCCLFTSPYWSFSFASVYTFWKHCPQNIFVLIMIFLQFFICLEVEYSINPSFCIFEQWRIFEIIPSADREKYQSKSLHSFSSPNTVDR